MKHAHLLFEGRRQWAQEREGNLLLNDGRVLPIESPFSPIVWLPPLPDFSHFTAITNPPQKALDSQKPRARTILALGLNYADHAKELAFKAPQEPLAFLKGENTLIGHRHITQRPPTVKHMHYECELTVVIGKTTKNVRRDDAYDFIAGYTIANDYAIRDYLENYYRPNFRVKNRDTCTPLGPWLVDAADIANPMNLALSTTVNGKLTQSGNTCDMIFDIPFLIEYFSSFMTLERGDLILTGTPDGVVDCPSGSEVITRIEGLGSLINTVV